MSVGFSGMLGALKKLFWDLSEADISFGTEEMHPPKLSLSYADLFSRFIEGALDSLGYKLLSRDISKGAVSMRFTRRVP